MSGSWLVDSPRELKKQAQRMARIWSRIDCSGDCWTYDGPHNGGGYARFGIDHVHRYVYLAAGGIIPAGLVLDHLCRNRWCVNPAHLEPVTPGENVRRGIQGALKTHCAQGHPWIDENIWRHRDGNGQRRGRCKLCVREANNRRYAERYAAIRRERRRLARGVAA